jgi:hypothetical protein
VVGKVPEKEWEDYEGAMNDLGANILQSSRRPVRAPAQRLGEHRKLLFRHLAGVRVLCREEVTANDPMHSMGEELDADVDMLATREMP